MNSTKPEEFTEGKIIILEPIEYDVIQFKKLEDEDKVTNFITKHGGTINDITRMYQGGSDSSERILESRINFSYYGISDYPDKYQIKVGQWILAPKSDFVEYERFIIKDKLPQCIKIKGEIIE